MSLVDRLPLPDAPPRATRAIGERVARLRREHVALREEVRHIPDALADLEIRGRIAGVVELTFVLAQLVRHHLPAEADLAAELLGPDDARAARIRTSQRELSAMATRLQTALVRARTDGPGAHGAVLEEAVAVGPALVRHICHEEHETLPAIELRAAAADGHHAL